MEHDTSTPTDTDTGSDHVDARPPRVVTIREAAQLCHTTRNAIRGRVERGSLHSVIRDGVRMIPLTDLERAGLYPPRSSEFAEKGDMHAWSGDPSHVADNGPHVGDLVGMLDRMTTRLVDAERRAAMLEGSKLLTERAESLLTAELEQAHTRIADLEAELRFVRSTVEAPRRRWFGLSRSS